jgi:hypothetical protein
MFGQGVLRFQNKQWWVYQGHDCPNGTHENGGHDQVPFW